MPLSLPATFAFSQSSLQAYANCPRRFWLAYVEQLPWPALETKPFDAYEEQISLMESVLEAEEIRETMRSVRAAYS